MLALARSWIAIERDGVGRKPVAKQRDARDVTRCRDTQLVGHAVFEARRHEGARADEAAVQEHGGIGRLHVNQTTRAFGKRALHRHAVLTVWVVVCCSSARQHHRDAVAMRPANFVDDGSSTRSRLP